MNELEQVYNMMQFVILGRYLNSIGSKYYIRNAYTDEEIPFNSFNDFVIIKGYHALCEEEIKMKDYIHNLLELDVIQKALKKWM